ncbi:uncharacterized protein LOC107620960 [Arachis ipaensis]|uniref:uncharacterized protein LOC107620960 n=1 Tax=Arachis ipaensis TaxID=130454 RepID=UPI0007AEEB22|nr:uncharacterized protein LOC107620960 [Arachis ipaensis]
MNNCKDAFAIRRYAGYPSYFIPMTCNPEWDEIKKEVTPIGLKAEDHPDILCRVFKIKLDGLIDDLKKRKIFGKILGYVCTIEFRKRGLSYAHILLFMSNKFKPQIPDDIDKHITAEIPDENERRNLHGAVRNYMVHEKESFVIRLPFYLEDEKPVIYSETCNVNDTVERAVSHKSMSLRWMAANMSYPYA